MRKLRHRNVELLAQGDTAGKLQSWDSNPGAVTPDHAPDPVHFITPTLCTLSLHHFASNQCLCLLRVRLTSVRVGRGVGSPPGCRTEGRPTSVRVERPAFRTASRSSRGRSLGERAGTGGPCLVQPSLRPVAARAISAPCGGSCGPHGWGAARRHGSQQGDGHRDPWLP